MKGEKVESILPKENQVVSEFNRRGKTCEERWQERRKTKKTKGGKEKHEENSAVGDISMRKNLHLIDS